MGAQFLDNPPCTQRHIYIIFTDIIEQLMKYEKVKKVLTTDYICSQKKFTYGEATKLTAFTGFRTQLKGVYIAKKLIQ